jgi:hypothetical protein
MSSRLADDPAVNPGRLVDASIILCKKPTRGVIKATRGVWVLKSPPEMDHPTHTQAAFEQMKTIDRHLQSALLVPDACTSFPVDPPPRPTV